MNKPTKYSLERYSLSSLPDKYKQATWEQLKEEAGRKLYKILEENPSPAVVRLEENIEPGIQFSAHSYDAYDRLTITVVVTPVKYDHVVLQKLDSTGFCALPQEPSPSFWDRVKGKFKWLKVF